jgi:hypothetical protein
MAIHSAIIEMYGGCKYSTVQYSVYARGLTISHDWGPVGRAPLNRGLIQPIWVVNKNRQFFGRSLPKLSSSTVRSTPEAF